MPADAESMARVILGPGGLPKIVCMLIVGLAIFLLLVLSTGIVWISLVIGWRHKPSLLQERKQVRAT